MLVMRGEKIRLFDPIKGKIDRNVTKEKLRSYLIQGKFPEHMLPTVETIDKEGVVCLWFQGKLSIQNQEQLHQIVARYFTEEEAIGLPIETVPYMGWGNLCPAVNESGTIVNILPMDIQTKEDQRKAKHYRFDEENSLYREDRRLLT